MTYLWNVAVFGKEGIDVVMTYPCSKETAMNMANELNRWVHERGWGPRHTATYIAFPVPCGPSHFASRVNVI